MVRRASVEARFLFLNAAGERHVEPGLLAERLVEVIQL